MPKIILFVLTLIFSIVHVLLGTSNLMLITIPKSGTHLLHKCLNLIDKKTMPFGYDGEFQFQRWYDVIKKKNALPPPHHWKGEFHPATIQATIEGIKKIYLRREKSYSYHAYYTDDYNKFLDSKNFKKILLLRDPRAIVVSYANMVKDGFEPGQTVDFEDLLLDLIDGRQENYISWASARNTAYPVIWEMGICNFYKLYLPFLTTKNCLAVHFEDLVGEHGGGSKERQRSEIKKILKHIGIRLDEAKITMIMNNLFGGSVTFFQGTIDGWKKHFTPKVKEAFKAVAGANELLRELGYEKDALW